MPAIRLLFVCYMAQRYYKDLVTGEYCLPWVRLHALKDYYGMVKMLDEFPGVHQTFNLVPSLIAQVQDYVSGAARDPFLEVAAKPAAQLNFDEKLFAIQYLFQANAEQMIGRYPRYRQLAQEFQSRRGLRPESRPEEAARLVSRLTNADITDLQVLSQIAWMDEFFLDEPEIRSLVSKGRDYSLEDQKLVIQMQREFLGKVLPAYKSAVGRGEILISTSPHYPPMPPLIRDTHKAGVSPTGLPLSRSRAHLPEA